MRHYLIRQLLCDACVRGRMEEIRQLVFKEVGIIIEYRVPIDFRMQLKPRPWSPSFRVVEAPLLGVYHCKVEHEGMLDSALVHGLLQRSRLSGFDAEESLQMTRSPKQFQAFDCERALNFVLLRVALQKNATASSSRPVSERLRGRIKQPIWAMSGVHGSSAMPAQPMLLCGSGHRARLVPEWATS
jgi:hypothetical protein